MRHSNREKKEDEIEKRRIVVEIVNERNKDKIKLNFINGLQSKVDFRFALLRLSS